jgi:hypothetical protein
MPWLQKQIGKDVSAFSAAILRELRDSWFAAAGARKILNAEIAENFRGGRGALQAASFFRENL